MEKKKKRDNGNKGLKKSNETKSKISKAMLGNLNAELYSEEQSLDLFGQMIVMSQDNNYTFIKQLTRQFGISYDVMINLTKRFPSLQEAYKLIKDNLETNCYTATNDGKLKLPLAMLNLKSNYGWTDRIENKTDVTTQGQPLQISNLITFTSGDSNDEENEE
ncbi:hypothetical protein [uncultured Empedobacter sp.]|uniref:hypothetical protein n=1 Tax=uncultured Empedobacter sp. TaxID=410844 RepID=UPI0025CC8320|nr:hypothetical protein [uncultured Empedobacter sp.]